MLDASTRMVADLVASGGVRRGRDAARLIRASLDRGRESDPFALMPSNYWSVLPDSASADGSTLVLRGAVLLRVKSRTQTAAVPGQAAPARPAVLPESLSRALNEPQRRPLGRAVGTHAARRHRRRPSLLAAALVLVSAGAFFEILLLRGFLEIARHPHAARAPALCHVGALRFHRCAAACWNSRSRSACCGSGGGSRRGCARHSSRSCRGSAIAISTAASSRTWRIAPTALTPCAGLPDLGANFARTSMQLIFTAVALAWLDPASVWIAAITAGLALVIPLATAPFLAERELRQRNHSAALSRHYLDSLLGLVAARTHGAERALRQQHESLLVEWGRSSVHLLRGGAVIEGVQMLVGSMLAAWLVLDFAARGHQPGSTLLLVYWALSLPVLGRDLTAIVRQFPANRNMLLRVLEPLDAPEEPLASKTRPHKHTRRGPAVRRRDGAGWQVPRCSRSVNLSVGGGEHVAVVGRSGAGKSTLVGLLLGWQNAGAGTAARWTESRSTAHGWWSCGGRRRGWIRRCSCGIDRSSTICATAIRTR